MSGLWLALQDHHDAGVKEPAWAPVVVVHQVGTDHKIWGWSARRSMLALPDEAHVPSPSPRLFGRVNTIDVSTGSDDDGVAGRAGASLRAWGPAGRAATTALLESIEAWARPRGIRVGVRTHAADAISDIPSCLSVARHWGRSSLGLVLDPDAMVTDGMHARAPEHFERIADALLELDAVEASILPALGGMDAARASHLGEFARRSFAAGRPVIVPVHDLAAWQGIVGAGGS